MILTRNLLSEDYFNGGRDRIREVRRPGHLPTTTAVYRVLDYYPNTVLVIDFPTYLARKIQLLFTVIPS
jgi:hypothetical protein